MNQTVPEIVEIYRKALTEGGSPRAIGRRFLLLGLGLQDLLAVHHEALLEAVPASDDPPTLLDRAATFLSDCAAPILAEQESDLRYRALVETALDIIATTTPEGVITSLNPAFERLTGWPREEWLGRPFTTILHPEDVPNLLTAPIVELRVRTASGGYCVMEIASREQVVDGRVVAILSIARDVTDRKRLDGRLQQGQKLQAIGQLAAGVAHEINNPVSYILTNVSAIADYFHDLRRLLDAATDGLARVVAGEDAARVREDVTRLGEEVHAQFLLKDFQAAVADAKEGAGRISEIVKSLKDFSHPDRGELKRADLNRGLESTIRVCWNELKYKTVVVRDYGDIPPVLCYPQRMNQVFMNLLVNAAQAIREKGEIRVSTRVEHGRVVVRIRDTGAGIAPEHLSKLFEPFFTTKPLGQGTGLGLHVAYKIVKGHGGDIEVASKVGEGTEFAIKLPLRPAGETVG